jgi:hypothetical protein
LPEVLFELHKGHEEVVMSIVKEERIDMSASERRLLDVLREKGPQTLDNLCALPDLGWAQVLLAVDHLSRSHEIVLKLIAPREYQVSLTRAQR